MIRCAVSAFHSLSSNDFGMLHRTESHTCTRSRQSVPREERKSKSERERDWDVPLSTPREKNRVVEPNAVTKM